MATARFPIPLLCAFLTIALPACARPKRTGAEIAPRVILRFASEHGDAYTGSEIEFAERVASDSNNAIRVQVYAGGELGTAAEIVEQLGFGGIGLSRVNVRAVSDISPTARSVSHFGAFSSSSEMTRAMTGDFAAQLTDELLQAKLVLLAWRDSGDETLYVPLASTPATTLRVAVDHPEAYRQILNSANRTQSLMPQSDFPHALSSGTVDAVIMPLQLAKAYRLSDILRETKTIPSRSLELILASRVIFQKILPSDRVLLETAAREVF